MLEWWRLGEWESARRTLAGERIEAVLFKRGKSRLMLTLDRLDALQPDLRLGGGLTPAGAARLDAMKKDA